MRDVVPTIEGWIREGRRVAICTVVRVERSAPRLPGSVMAVADTGEVAGSVTGGCVESALYEQTGEVLAGGPARLATFGIVDDEAFAVGLPCGGTVHVFVEMLDPRVFAEVAEALRAERPVAYLTTISGPEPGGARVVGREEPSADAIAAAAQPLLALGRSGVVEAGGREVFVSSLVPRPAMYIFGAIDFASALATVGRFMGYRVTVCDPRALFLTPARFPDADELVTEWPHEFLRHAPVDERTAICVLTHDEKFDVPALMQAVTTPAGYIGAMGSSRTTARRRARLIAQGVSEGDLARIHAPIGLAIGSRTPEEVALAIGAAIVAVASGVPRPLAR